jgi:hypothetical protein
MFQCLVNSLPDKFFKKFKPSGGWCVPVGHPSEQKNASKIIKDNHFSKEHFSFSLGEARCSLQPPCSCRIRLKNGAHFFKLIRMILHGNRKL